MNLELNYHVFQFDTVTLENEQIIKFPKQAKYFVEDLGNGVTIEMIYIPEGSFLMGSPDDDGGYSSNSTPQHLVNVPSFHMSKFAVTEEQWEAVTKFRLSFMSNNNYPITYICWRDAVKFCQKLTSMTGRNYRLPTEAEWEYACRGGTNTLFSFGDIITTKLANYFDHYITDEEDKEDNALELLPVGSYFPNPFGLYDMHGNIFEFCQDGWHNNYTGAPTDGSAWGSGEDTGDVIIRGGSFDYYDENCR